MSLVIHNSVQSGLLTASQADIFREAIAVYVNNQFAPCCLTAGRKGVLQMAKNVLGLETPKLYSQLNRLQRENLHLKQKIAARDQQNAVLRQQIFELNRQVRELRNRQSRVS